MKIVTPELGTSKADKVTRTQIAKLHAKLHKTPFQANRVLAVMGSLYAFAGRTGACRRAPIPSARSTSSKNTVASGSSLAQSLSGSAQPSERQRRKAFRGSLMKRSPRQGTFQSQKIAIPRWPVRGGGPSPLAVHRMPAAGNPASQVEPVDLERGPLSFRQQERPQDYNLNAPAMAVLSGLDRARPLRCAGR